MNAIVETATANFYIGPRAIDAYSRLSYTMWNALAEYIDNSTQSRLNYGNVIDDVLRDENKPLTVSIHHNKVSKTLTIEDNSIGMNKEKLIASLQIAEPTVDSKGRSRYGMGMKTASCWIGKRWQVVTCEWGSGEEWTADIDVKKIAFENSHIPLTKRAVGTDAHYTKIIITDLNRNIQKRTEETIRGYLGSMYRFDLANGSLKLVYNDDDIPQPDEYEFDRDPDGHPMRQMLPEGLVIGGKKVSGWFGVLRTGGRKYGGFSLFQNQRQIQGFPNAWKPRSIFGGVDDEGANNLVSQRLTGLIELDDAFQVSHTKDAILFEGDEEEELERTLLELTRDYANYSQRRRGPRGNPLRRENVRDLINSLRSEFNSGEMRDAVANAVLPPLETILANNRSQVANLREEDRIGVLSIAGELEVIVSMRETSDFEPYVTLAAGAEAGKIHVIINALHPYYINKELKDAADECVTQFIYDAVAEYKVSKSTTGINPNSVRRMKDTLLRVHTDMAENVSRRTADELRQSSGTQI